VAPLLVLVAVTLFLRALGSLRVRVFSSWRNAVRYGLVIMFLSTGSTHFTAIKHDYAAMVPPPLTGHLWLIYFTGILELMGAIGLAIPRTRRLAGIGLFLLLLALFPANVYAASNGIQFRGAPPTEVWLRGFVQAVFAVAVWWSAVTVTDSASRRSL
jgi:uncharacterized membrane protein